MIIISEKQLWPDKTLKGIVLEAIILFIKNHAEPPQALYLGPRAQIKFNAEDINPATFEFEGMTGRVKYKRSFCGLAVTFISRDSVEIL